MRWRVGWLATAGAALAFGLTAPAASTSISEASHTCSWSYFGDARSLIAGGRILWGCVTGQASAVVEQYDPRTGARLHVTIHHYSEADDHSNPSLAIWRRRLYAFYAPHSGYWYPVDRRSRMQYRVARGGLGIGAGFGRERSVRTNTPGGLGFSYPNPVATRDRLWLFWRGGNWEPSFSYTSDGEHWAKARTLVVGPGGQRPYAKYAAGPDGSIHVILSEAHVRSYRTGLYYVRYRAGRFYAADGRLIARMRDLPLHFGELDRIHSFRSITPGRAWPHDVAVDGRRRPVVVYTRRHGGANGTDVFWYARFNGSRWERHRIVSAGTHALAFVSGGITLDHAQPSRVVLSRRAALGFQIELWRTPDGGRTWEPPLAITPRSHDRNYRPVIPRGYRDQDRVVVLYLHGWMRCCRTFRRIQSVVRMGSADATAAGADR